jgi:NAD(P)H-dependent FMN reductase
MTLEPVRVLLVSGSLRRGSTNTAALRTAAAGAPDGVSTTAYEGLAQLPAFNPDDDVDPLPEAVAALRSSVRSADAVLFSAPEYAGALPGAFKNLLDWLIGDDQPGSIYEKPVAWINTSPRGAAAAYASLRTVLSYAHATIVEDACVHVALTSDAVDADGFVADAPAAAQISNAMSALARAVSSRHAGEPDARR